MKDDIKGNSNEGIIQALTEVLVYLNEKQDPKAEKALILVKRELKELGFYKEKRDENV